MTSGRSILRAHTRVRNISFQLPQLLSRLLPARTHSVRRYMYFVQVLGYIDAQLIPDRHEQIIHLLPT